MKLIDDYILDDNEQLKPDFRNLSSEASADITSIIHYLKSGNGYVSMASLWSCEFCDGAYSNLYHTDGKWMWGKWLIHYLEKHFIGLPHEFVKDIRSLKYRCPQLSDEQINRLISGEVEEIDYA